MATKKNEQLSLLQIPACSMSDCPLTRDLAHSSSLLFVSVAHMDPTFNAHL